MGRLPVVVVVALAAVVAAGGAGGEPLRERVEVRVVLLDVLATDAAGRTVPDLGADEFTVLVDSRPVVVDSVDVLCPAGAAGEPRMVDRPDERARPSDAAAPRRIVLALDYLHLDRVDRAALLESLRGAVPHLLGPGDEAMVVALANDVRVEQPFTGDVGRIVDTLGRMRDDITLWAPAFDRLTEHGFFEKLERLLVVLQALPGPEALVLYSNHPGRSDTLDPQFAAVAAAAAAGRVAIYPVHAAGLQPPDATDPTANVLGGPRLLARLAVETGGRMTRNTNDMSLGIARARRDLGCRYTLGFRDDRPDDRAERRVAVRVTRDGVRLRHPERYAFRGPDEEADAVARAAVAAPEAFAGDGVRVEAVVWGPVDARRWEVLLVVEVANGAGTTLTTELARPTAVVEFHGSRSLVDLVPAEPGGRLRLASPVRVRPGRYRLSAVVTGANGPPRTAVLDVRLPDLPRDRPFLVGPFVGTPLDATNPPPRLADGDVGTAPAFVSDLRLGGTADRVEAGTPLVAAARLCSFDGVPRGLVLRLGPAADVDADVRPPAEAPDTGCLLAAGGVTTRSGRLTCTAATARLDTGRLATGAWRVVAAAGALRSDVRFRMEAPR